MTGAIVMAGGLSERMRAGGDRRHKALRFVAGRRLIDWNVQALKYFGFEEIYVAVNAREQELIDYLRFCGDLHLLVERAPLGTIGAARCLPTRVTHAVVVNADNLTDMNLAELARFHVAHKAAMTIAAHDEAFPIQWGRLRVDGDCVIAYEEKPLVPVRVSSGTYVLNRRAIELIQVERRVDVPELVTTLLASGHPVRAWAHTARWVDINDETALTRADCLIHESGPRWPGSSLLQNAGA